MNIGITCYPTYGGSGIIATELGKALARAGDEVHFIASSLPVRLSAFDERIHFHEVGGLAYPLFEHPPYTLNLTNRMVKVVREHHIDVLHVHYAIPHAVSAVLARDILTADVSGVKIVTTLHGTDILLVGQDESYFDITKYSMEQSDALTAVSDYLSARTKEIFGITKNIRVIKNFVDVAVFSRDAFAGSSVVRHGSSPVLLHVSNFRPVKDIAVLIKAFARVRKRADAHLVLAGDGPERPAMEKLVRSLSLSQNVTFLGATDALPAIMASSDIFLLSSTLESFGLAALEAMAMGVPVVSTDCGGIREVVADGVTGRIVPVGDHEGMANAVCGLIDDVPLRKRMGDASYQRVRDEFTIERIVPRYRDVYASI
ncbi:MAG: N-acetyl-alpha-D-glucosaminyl L-malate synthase BshA [Spirochaetota bacterium]|mgnify:CR=1 FL=1